MSSAGVIAHSIFGGSVWFTGPVALNGAAGGSENYYKKTEDLTDWSDAPIALPLGKTALQRITSAHTKVWMAFTAGNSVVSSDNGETWTECDVDLPEEEIYFNGRVYVCHTLLSTNGVNWTTIPNLSGTPRFTAARQQDNLIVCAYAPGTATYFEYTFDEGVTWTTVLQGGSFADEDVYSLTVGNRTGRINYSLNNVAPSSGISGFYTDDLFVTKRLDGGSYSGRYESLYGCSHLAQIEATDRVILSKDGGWSWKDADTGLTISITERIVDYGKNQWGIANRVAAGPPNQFSIRYSTDGGDTWNTGDTVYGSITSLTHVGRDGNCAVYGPPEYAATSATELWQGDPSAITALAVRAWGGDPIVSPDGTYIIDKDSGNNMLLYKKATNGMGFNLVEGAFPSTVGAVTSAISYDNQYFCGRLSAGGWWAFRRVGDVYTSLTIPGATYNFADMQFHPTTNTLICAHATSAVLVAYTLSGTTISGPYLSDSTGNTPRSVRISHNGEWAIVSTTLEDLRLLDITDVATSIPVLASSLLTNTAGGNVGAFFSGDDTGIITVSQPVGVDCNIHYHSWDGASAIGAATLLGTMDDRVQGADLTQDGTRLIAVRDTNLPHVTVVQFPTSGASITSTYSPAAGSGQTTGTYVRWMGV